MPIARMKLFHGQLTIGEEGTLQTFGSQVTSITLTPSVDRGDDVFVLDGGTAPGDRTESWVMAGTLLQDFGETTNETALTEFCFTNRGKELPFVFVPNDTSAKQVTGNLVVEAVAIGGDVNTQVTSDFEFPLVGEPVLGAVPAP